MCEMERKKVHIYEKERESIKFLKSFFKKRKDYSVSFFEDKAAFLKSSNGRPPDACLLGSPECLDEVAPSIGEAPVVAMVPSDIAGGMRSIVKNNIEFYVLSPFHADDLDFKLKTISNRNNWLSNLYGQIKDLEAIVELTYLVSSTLDPNEVLYFVVKKISEFINVTRCSIISLGYGEKRYANVVSSHEDPEIRNIKLDLKKYPEIRKALRLRKPVVIKNAMKDPVMKSVRDIIKPLGINSIVVIPMVYRDEVIGSLFLRTSTSGHIFTEREIKLCASIASAAVNPLYHAFLFEKLEKEKARLEKLAITDYLTGSYNIRYLYHRLEEEFQRSRRYGSPLSCIMFDIDHFKKVNDTYGHRAGDMVLREFSSIVRKQIRKSDVFARYGGEEFVLLLPHTPKEGALIEAGRLQEIVKSHQFKALGEKNRLTVSMGISIFPSRKVDSSDRLITVADNALFEAKKRGRDRIVVS